MSSGCQGTRTTTGSRYRTNSTGMPRAVCAGIVRERLPKGAGHYREAGSGMREFLGLLSAGVGGSRGLAWAHNPKVAGSNPAPATKQIKGFGINVPKPLMVLSVFCPWFHEEGALSGLSWTRSLTLRAGTILLHGYKLTPSPERFTLRHDSPLLGGVLVHSTKKVRIFPEPLGEHSEVGIEIGPERTDVEADSHTGASIV